MPLESYIMQEVATIDPVAQAKYDYMTELNTSLPEVLRRYNLPSNVERVADDEDWLGQKRKLFAERYQARNALFREEISQRRLPMVNTQLEIVEKLQERVLLLLDSYGHKVADSVELRRLSETLSSITASMNALLGIKEAMNDATSKRQGDGGGDNFFFFPNAMPLGVAVRSADAALGLKG